MGKQSTRENKTIYQICREEAGLTRSEASENTTVQSSFKIPQDAFTPNIKNFPINQIMHIANSNDNIFYSF